MWYRLPTPMWGNLEPPVIPAPRSFMPSSGLKANYTEVTHRHIHTHTHTKVKKCFLEKEKQLVSKSMK